jgi:hypothetical protein
MMGGGRDPIGNLVRAVGATLKAGKDVYKTLKK